MTSKSVYFRLALLALTFFGVSAAGQDLGIEKKFVPSGKGGIIRLPSLHVKFFEVSDPLRPRIGRFASPTEVGERDLNFVYCDGTLGKVDVDSLTETKRECPKDSIGIPLSWETAANLTVGISVYSSRFEPVGQVVSIGKVLNGERFALVSFADGWSIPNVGVFAFDGKISSASIAEIDRLKKASLALGLSADYLFDDSQLVAANQRGSEKQTGADILVDTNDLFRWQIN